MDNRPKRPYSIGNFKPLITQPIRDRKIISMYKNKPRCCYLMPNGKRCTRKAIGLYRSKDGRLHYNITCAQHSKICARKYALYKLQCAKVFKEIKNLNTCATLNRASKNNATSHIASCMKKRKEFPKTCTYGCLKHPGSKLGKKLLKKHDNKHEHVLAKLKKCRKNLANL